MSAPSDAPAVARPDAARPAGSVSLGHVMRSEWTKMRSVRSTFWTTLSLFSITVGFSLLISWAVGATFDEMTPQDQAGTDPTQISLAGMTFGQLAIVVLGVMVITTEYSTGGIRTTLSSVPRRGRVLAAKGIVLGLFALVVGTVTSFASFFVGQAFLSIADIDVSLGDPEVARAVVGGGLYLAASAMFGFAVGALVRSTAAGITLAVALLFVLPLIAFALPGDWGDVVTRYFTSNAGQQITAVETSSELLGPWQGFAVFCVWWVVLLAGAAVLFRRRDA